VTTGFLGSKPALNSKPAIEVTTGFLPSGTPPAQDGKRPAGASEPYREMIELELSRGRNAMGMQALEDSIAALLSSVRHKPPL
jgi:hypothetical protein